MMQPVPAVTIVVPTYRRPELLSRCLAALATQDLSEPYEIVVADDAGDAPTREIVAVWQAQAPERVALRYLRVEGRHGPAAARNRGWQAARAEIIAFTDDDTVPAVDWLRRGLETLRQGGYDAVAGHISVPLPEDPTDYERDAAHLDGAEFATANCLVRRRALEDVAGFDERFRLAWREDSDLFFSLLARGHRVGRAQDAVVLHPVRPAPWGVSLRQQRKVYFDALLYKKHPQLFREKVRRAPPWDYFIIVAALLLALGAAAAGAPRLAISALAVWATLTARFCWRRLRHTRRTPAHVAEMVFTSITIPPAAVFWRLAGALHYRVFFP